ncbi:MAG TPA: hypothetical protein VFC00_16560 [Micromonosporaceae bacterium]|nr:hypothetical protein [Micromonosporaceae bacterium]
MSLRFCFRAGLRAGLGEVAVVVVVSVAQIQGAGRNCTVAGVARFVQQLDAAAGGDGGMTGSAFPSG